MTKTHGSWIWYELMTPDVAGAKAFYEVVVPGGAITPGDDWIVQAIDPQGAYFSLVGAK